MKDKYGETSIAWDDDASSIESLTPQIFAPEYAKPFYRATGRSKKGLVYGLGSQGVLMVTRQRNSFVAPQATQLQPIVDDIIITPSLKRVVGRLMNAIVW